MTISNVELMSSITKMLSSEYGIKNVTSTQMNKILDASTTLAEVVNHEVKNAEPGMGITAWLASDDVGMSSKFMAYHLKYSSLFSADYAVPQDGADFRRCLKLLKACPELEPLLSEMKTASPAWARLIQSWDLIKSHVENSDGESAYKLIQECVD